MISKDKGPDKVRAFLFVKRDRLLAGVLQNVFCKVVFDAGIVVQSLIICGLQQLLTALAKLLADVLLHAGIIDLALPGLFFADQLDDLVAAYGLTARRRNRQNDAHLTGTEVHDGLPGRSQLL